MSKAELARRASITERTVRNLEQGVYEPKMATARKLAQALGVPFDDLFAEARR